MTKKHSLKFWIIFWVTSAIFLTGWYLFWEVKDRGLQSATVALDYLPIEGEKKDKLEAATAIGNYLLEKDGKEKVFLVLFQNNMEIRPGGGYIGTFGIIKIKDGKIVSTQTHDLSNFDGRIPDTVKPPYPMEETLHIKSWKMRDSNFSPDFPVNAQKAEEFYYLGQGEEKFDGVVAITANVLTSLLKVTGPVQIEGYPGSYESENAIIALEYQVEKGYAEQEIQKGERKLFMNELAAEILKKVDNLNAFQKLELLRIIVDDLDKKDIQLYFKNEKLEGIINKVNWGGKVDADWDKDFLMLVDANLGAFKSDYYVKRSVDYSVDFSGDIPKAALKISYDHTAQQKDWMANDYVDYVRIYVPEGAWLESYPGLNSPRFGKEFGKKYFGFLVKVPLGQSKTFEFNYNLPKELKDQPYNLKIQKQAGINDVPVSIHAVGADGARKDYTFQLNSDWVLNK